MSKNVNQLKHCMNEILCPLIKESSRQVIQKAKGSTKQALLFLYDKLLSYMSTNMVRLNTTDVTINHTNHDKSVTSNSDITRTQLNEF